MTASSTRRAAQVNAVVAALAEVAGKLTTLAWTVVAARVLTQEDFGAFSLALAIAVMASSLPEWGFDPVLVVRGGRDRAAIPRLHSQAIGWQTGIGIPVFLIAGIVAWSSRPGDDARAALVFVLLAVFLDMWSDTARSSSAAAQNQAGTASAISLQRFAAAALIIPALLLGLGLPGMAAAFFLSSVVGWVAHIVAIRRLGIGFRLSLLDVDGMRAFARGTFLIGLSSLVLMALFRIDTLLLAAIVGDREVGEYTAAYRLFETVLFLAYAVNGAVTPVVSARRDDRPEVRRVVELAMAALSAIYVPFGLVCLLEAEAIVELLYGERYSGAAPALQWLSVSAAIYGISAVTGMILVVFDRARAMLVAAVVALVVNVAMNLVLIPELEGTGAAIATTTAYAIEAAIGAAFAIAIVGRLRITRLFGEAVAAAVPLAAVLLVLDLPLLVEVPIGLAAYAAAWLWLVHRRRPDLEAALLRVLPGRA